jgi:hypothetical protein
MLKSIPLLITTLFLLACADGNGQEQTTSKDDPGVRIVSPHDLKHLFLGTENPINLVLDRLDHDEVILQANKGKLRKGETPGRWYIEPDSIGAVIFTVFDAKTKDQLRVQKWLVVALPDPLILVGDYNVGEAKALDIYKIDGIRYTWEFPIEVPFEILSFQMKLIPLGGEPISLETKGTLFSTKMKKMIASARKGDLLLIEEVIVLEPTGYEHAIPGPTLVIVE